MGRFEDNLLKQFGLSSDDVSDEQRQAAKETEDRLNRAGNSMMALGCGMTIAVLLAVILWVLVSA